MRRQDRRIAEKGPTPVQDMIRDMVGPSRSDPEEASIFQSKAGTGGLEADAKHVDITADRPLKPCNPVAQVAELGEVGGADDRHQDCGGAADGVRQGWQRGGGG
jgi:hypothetical protein